MRFLILIFTIVLFPSSSKAQFYDMGPGSAWWMYQQQQQWNVQQQLWQMQHQQAINQANNYMYNYIKQLQQEAAKNIYNPVPITGTGYPVPVEDNPYKGHYETKKEECPQCGGRGYHERMYYTGSSQGNKTIRRDCGACVNGYVTKREYVLDN